MSYQATPNTWRNEKCLLLSVRSQSKSAILAYIKHEREEFPLTKEQNCHKGGQISLTCSSFSRVRFPGDT